MKNLNLIKNSIKITAALLLANALLSTPVSAREIGQSIQPLMFSGSAIAEMFIDKCVSGNCVNGKGKIVYDNGNTYEGDFVDSKLEGQGTFTVTNGQIYIGQFANDKYNGRGKITFPTGEIYEGDWIDDKKHGKGKNTFPNGDIYDGNWVNDKREGQGTLTFLSGSYYIGEWKNDNYNGYAKYYDKATNTVQEGTWKDGVLANSATANAGQQTFTGGEIYDKAPTTNSPSTNKCVSGDCVNGGGKMVYNIGNTTEYHFFDIYEGDFVNGKKEGQGTFTSPNGAIYVGQFANDFRNGKGKQIFPNREIYDGNWVDDTQKGQGTLTDWSGSYYIGEWKYDSRNGFGKEYKKSTNTTREGYWWNDNYIGGLLLASRITQFAPKTGTLTDCKIIISEGCRNYLLQSTAAEILPQFEDARIFKGKELVSNAFRAKIVEATGGILSVEFSGEFKNPFGQPAENVKWGESAEKVKKKLGEPLQIGLGFNKEYHSYKNFELVYFVNKLSAINLSRELTEAEIASEETSYRAELLANRIANTPENRAKKLKADAVAAYYETVEQCNRIMGYYNDKVEQANRETTRVAQDIVRSWNSGKTAKAVANMKALLENLLRVHGANLPADMKQQIEAQLKSLN